MASSITQTSNFFGENSSFKFYPSLVFAEAMLQLFTAFLAVADVVTIYHVNPSNYSAQGIAEMDTVRAICLHNYGRAWTVI